MKKVLLLIYLVQLIAPACNKCSDKQSITRGSFGVTYNSLMPFAGNESLIFLKNGIDTIAFNGNGKEVFYSTGYGNDGVDCEIEYKLINHRIKFISAKENKTITFWMYKDIDDYDYFRFDFSTFTIGSRKVFDMFEDSTSSMIVFGKSYPYTKKYYNILDTVYFNFKSGDDPKYKIVRIKYNNDTYEVIP